MRKRFPYRFLTGLLLTAIPLVLTGQGGYMSREAYIQTYSELAMKEMARVGIPASITLAQGMLESDNGNSTLAMEGNNHFGIKCHDWTGRSLRHHDDRRNECFRAYNSVYESFRDHSQFLTTKDRYASLFELRPSDYRGWARGLKKAGYATANDYASMLIRIIEENELYRYDLLVLKGGMGYGTDTTNHLADHPYNTTREVLVNNRIEYIITEPGDTPEGLRSELDLYRNEIYRYNNLYKGSRLKPGQIIYLQPKKRKAAHGNEIHVVQEGETMFDISQIYGVKVKQLYRKNGMLEGAQPMAGAEIYLRRKKPGTREKQANRLNPGARIKPEPMAEEPEEVEMEFVFEH